MKDWKFRLVVFLGILFGFVAFSLAIYYFQTRGVYALILFLVLLAAVLTVYDLSIYKKLKKIYENASSTLDFEGGIRALKAFEKKRLTKNQQKIYFLYLYIFLLYEGDVDTAVSIREERLPFSLFKGIKQQKAYYDLLKDEALIRLDKEQFLEINEKERKELRLNEGEEASSTLTSLFFFSLEEGFIDPSEEKDALAELEKEGESSLLDRAFYLYCFEKCRALRHQKPENKDELVRLSKGTFLSKYVRNLYLESD